MSLLRFGESLRTAAVCAAVSAFATAAVIENGLGAGLAVAAAAAILGGALRVLMRFVQNATAVSPPLPVPPLRPVGEGPDAEMPDRGA